jgi:hypothetical protein
MGPSVPSFVVITLHFALTHVMTSVVDINSPTYALHPAGLDQVTGMYHFRSKVTDETPQAMYNQSLNPFHAGFILNNSVLLLLHFRCWEATDRGKNGHCCVEGLLTTTAASTWNGFTCLALALAVGASKTHNLLQNVLMFRVPTACAPEPLVLL